MKLVYEFARLPYLRSIPCIRGIIRNRLSDIDERTALLLLEQAVEQGTDIEHLTEHAKQIHTWAEWKLEMETIVSQPATVEGCEW